MGAAGGPEHAEVLTPARAHVFVRGRVQGVFFRALAAHAAAQLGLAGWVRNIADGRVEAVFQGERAAVERMIDWCRSGPPMARVDGLEASWEEARPGETPFRLR